MLRKAGGFTEDTEITRRAYKPLVIYPQGITPWYARGKVIPNLERRDTLGEWVFDMLDIQKRRTAAPKKTQKKRNKKRIKK
jgi:hypothetical protein